MKIKYEYFGISFVYAVLFFNAYITHDSIIALISAFCGITYTILAGKGNPVCYFIGLTGSAFYGYLALTNRLWGNLLLYLLYYIPMQIIGYVKWNRHLKDDKYEIIKTKLPFKENLILFSLTFIISFAFVLILTYLGDKSPVIDGVTTIFSILGMYLTVRRAIEQWLVWAGVNILSLIMWLNIALSGEKVYSTLVMWLVYSVLAVYFYFVWRKELKDINYSNNS